MILLLLLHHGRHYVLCAIDVSPQTFLIAKSLNHVTLMSWRNVIWIETLVVNDRWEFCHDLIWGNWGTSVVLSVLRLSRLMQSPLAFSFKNECGLMPFLWAERMRRYKFWVLNVYLPPFVILTCSCLPNDISENWFNPTLGLVLLYNWRVIFNDFESLSRILYFLSWQLTHSSELLLNVHAHDIILIWLLLRCYWRQFFRCYLMRKKRSYCQVRVYYLLH